MLIVQTQHQLANLYVIKFSKPTQMMQQIQHLISQPTDPQQLFQLLNPLGQGSYGIVSKALHKQTGQLYAIKILPATSGIELASIKKQITILKDCNDDHIVKYYGSYYRDSYLWIVMEYCIAGSVADIMHITNRKFGEVQIASILESALKGLQYIHARKKIHRDIKAGNILLDQKGNAKLADFGVSASAVNTNARFRTHIGSPFWMSPQILRYSQYDYKTDIWSLGITAIQLAEGQAPNSHMKPFMAIFWIKSNPVQSLKQPSQWSPQFNDFIKQCLQITPSNRPQAKQLLQHSFIKKFSKGQRLLSELVWSSIQQIQQYRMNQSRNSSFAQIIVDEARDEGNTNTIVAKQSQNEPSPSDNELQNSMIILQSHRSQKQSIPADSSMIEHEHEQENGTSGNGQGQDKNGKSGNILADYINDMRQREEIMPIKCAEMIIKTLNNYDRQLTQMLEKLFADFKGKVLNDVKALEEIVQKNSRLNFNIAYKCKLKQCQNLKEFICPVEQKMILHQKQNLGTESLLINSRSKFPQEEIPNSKLILVKHNQSTQQRQRQPDMASKISDQRKQTKSFLIPNNNSTNSKNLMLKGKKVYNFGENQNFNGSESSGKASQFQAPAQRVVPNSHNSSRIVLKGAVDFKGATESQINEFKQPQILQYLQRKYLNKGSQLTNHTQSNYNYNQNYTSTKINKLFQRLTSTQQSKSKSRGKPFKDKDKEKQKQRERQKQFKGKKNKSRPLN